MNTDTDPRSLYDAVAAELTATSPATAGKMFGMPCLKSNGKAFAGYFNNAMIFKLTAPEHGEALALADARLFDPMGGRPMKEWVEVPVEHAARWPAFARAALRYVAKHSNQLHTLCGHIHSNSVTLLLSMTRVVSIENTHVVYRFINVHR